MQRWAVVSPRVLSLSLSLTPVPYALGRVGAPGNVLNGLESCLRCRRWDNHRCIREDDFIRARAW